jgi:hypothetical protein
MFNNKYCGHAQQLWKTEDSCAFRIDKWRPHFHSREEVQAPQAYKDISLSLSLSLSLLQPTRTSLSLSATTYKDISRSPMSRRGSSFVVSVTNSTAIQHAALAFDICFSAVTFWDWPPIVGIWLREYAHACCWTWVKCCFCLLAQAEGITKGYRKHHGPCMHYRSTRSPHVLPHARMHAWHSVAELHTSCESAPL